MVKKLYNETSFKKFTIDYYFYVSQLCATRPV